MGYNSTMSTRQTRLTDQVRRAILTSGLTRYRISKVCGVEEAALSRFMAGKTSLTLTSLDRMADMLGLNVVARGPRRAYPPAKPGPKPKKGRVTRGKHRKRPRRP